MAGTEPAYRDPSLGTDERVADLLARMTLEEKVAQLGSAWVTADPDSGEVAPHQGQFAPTDDLTVEERLRHGLGHLTRVLGSRPVAAAAGARAVNALQRRLVEGTRLGLPAIVHEECLAGLMALGATAFPSPLNLGATWDTALVEEIGREIGCQLRAVGAHQGLAPVLDVVRDARWGRVEECFGEDPWLVGAVGAAYVRGVQASGVAATVKHFAGYSASEGGRNLAPAHVGPRELADVFLVPYEWAVREASVLSVMNAYQEIDGLPVAASRALLTDALRRSVGFDGVVVSDYFAVAFLHTLHNVAGDRAEAAALALRAGIDIELPSTDCYGQPLVDAVRCGLVGEDDVDTAVRRVLRQKIALGLLERPYVEHDGPIDLDPPEARALARRAADASIVLLRNHARLLPLPADVGHVAVIGPNGDDGPALLGNYSFENHVAAASTSAPPGVPVVSIAAGLRAALPGADVTVARGCEPTGQDRSGFDAAVEAARFADAAVVVVGDRAGHFNRGTVGEGTDTDDLALPGVQEDLVAAVAATGTDTVVVVVCGRPYDLSRVAAVAGAVLVAWFPGEEGGNAVAGVLTGAVEPSGRTPVSFSAGAGQQPYSYDRRRLARGRYWTRTTEPVFPFGHGLTYTTFGYDGLDLPEVVPVDGEAAIACTVTNTGGRPGTEVVQLYVRDPVATVTRPARELRAFARVPLEPRRSATVRFIMPADVLAFCGADFVRRVEPGAVDVLVGASSADIRLRGRFELRGQARVVGSGRRLRTDVTVEPWNPSKHPV